MFGWFERRTSIFHASNTKQVAGSGFGFALSFSKGFLGWQVIVACLNAMAALAETGLIYLTGKFVDVAATADKTTFFVEYKYPLIAVAFFFAVVLPLLALLQNMIEQQVLAVNFPLRIRWRMHLMILPKSIAYFANEYAGGVANRVVQAASTMQRIVETVLNVFIQITTYIVVLTFSLADAEPKLLIPIGIWLTGQIALGLFFLPRFAKNYDDIAEKKSAMNGRMIDTYTNITTVKLFSHSGQEEDYARQDISSFASVLKKQYRMVTIFRALLVVNNYWSILALAGLCLFSWSIGQVAIGTLAASIGMFLRLTGTVEWVIWQINGFMSDAATLKDSAQIFNDDNSVDDIENAPPLTVTAGKIEFDNVAFAYRAERPILHGLSLSIQPGEKIGLVGRSGAGKTTLMNLLLRFYDVTSGVIRVDGQNIALVNQDSLRGNIGVVTQDTSLLHRSIRDNIGYGRPHATDDDIIKAAKRAKAWDFIQALEDQTGRKGLDAHTGERGVKLSGGQRQRIAIARVFLKDAPILILDEATSALDSEVEAAIQENLFDLMQGKTVIAIAHRLSTLTEMDRLVVLDKGDIVETGNHAQLVANGGLYADLWSRQSGGFIADDPLPKPETEKV